MSSTVCRRHAMAVAVLGAAMMVIGLAAPANAAGERPTSRYCADRDAYEIQPCAAAPLLPATPVGGQLRWILRQLGGGAATLTDTQIKQHFSPEYLHSVLPSGQVVQVLQQTAAQAAPGVTLAGYASPPRRRQAVALGSTVSAGRVAVAVSLDRRDRIERLAIEPGRPVIVPTGRYSGMIPVGHGRRMFLRCTGHGGPTVVFELGLTTDWYTIQNALSRHTRVCSYDHPNADAPFSRSDPAPTPRTSADVVADLHAMLANAHLPGPYMLAGFSNGGLNSLLYASTYPRQVAGLILIDAVHPDYYARRLALLERFLPPALYAAFRDASLQLAPRLLDSEQFDIVTSLAQTRAALTAHPLRSVPTAVLTHALASPPPPAIPDFPTSADEALWRQLQNELAALEPGSDHVLATRSDHDIPLNQPDLVVAETREVIDRVRHHQSS